MAMPSNNEFIQAVFGLDAPFCHVTDFTHDPSNIPNGMAHLVAWKGDYFSRYSFYAEPSNQYFTISTFHPDDKGTARRRKALYKQTHCIVLDDVKEKLVQSEVDKLPAPSWVLETSPGSEQWGYILSTPAQDRARVENLLDGLIANGLAPDGVDSGMKGVTRYVRLPDGYNNKAKKLVNGQPFKCRMLSWNPFNTTTLEALAAPLRVDLDAVRRDARVDGAAHVSDHPMLELTDIIHIKEVRSEGRFDITCPWVEDHTGQDDSGTAVFTNADGSLGFKCHHGHCQDKTGKDLLDRIEKDYPDFRATLGHWQVMRAFGEVADTVESPTSVQDAAVASPPPPPPPVAPVAPVAPVEDGNDAMLNMLRREPPGKRARQLASEILKSVDSYPAIEKLHLHEQVRDIMRWSKPEFNLILNDLRETWYEESSADVNFFDDVIFVAEQNQFFDRRKRLFYTPEAYQNTYAHLSPEARKDALQGGRVQKVDRLDFAPLKPAVFEEDGITYGNSWHNINMPVGVEGDASPWLNHIDTLGWGRYKKHILQWMAFTILHPDRKINHMIIMGSGEGAGKDFLLHPLITSMKQQQHTVDGQQLLSDFNPYLLSTKYLHINEAELGDRKEAMAVSNKLKPLAAAPPDKLNVNDKGVKNVQVRNIVNCTMTTNSTLPVKVNGPSRRMFCLWSDLDVRDASMTMTPEWKKFWKEHWHWMRNGGAEVCIWYLRNCVDLSDFDAGAAPPVTDFMRDIVEASKSPLELTIDSLAERRVGAMEHDLVTAKEIELIIKTGMSPESLYVNTGNVSHTTISTCLNSSTRYISFRTRYGTVYAVRNLVKYRGLDEESISALYEENRPEETRVITKDGKVVTFELRQG